MAWCRDSCSINYYENKQKLASVIHFVSLAKHKWGVIKTLGEQVYKNQKPYVLNLSSSCLCIFHIIQAGSSTAAPPHLFFFFSAAFWKPQFSTHSKPWGSAKGEEQQQRECASIFSTSTARYRNEAFYCTALRFLRKNTHTHLSILDHWPILAPNNSFSWKWKWPSKHIQISYHLILQICCCSLVI